MNFGPWGLWAKKCPQAARTTFADESYAPQAERARNGVVGPDSSRLLNFRFADNPGVNPVQLDSTYRGCRFLIGDGKSSPTAGYSNRLWRRLTADPYVMCPNRRRSALGVLILGAAITFWIRKG